MKRQWFFLSAILALLNLTIHAATTYYVDANGTNPISPYTSWVTAATNIQDAVNFAGSGDTVLVTNGVYQYGNTGNSRIAIYALTVQSVNGPAFTTIQGYQVPGTTNGSDAVRCALLYSGATLSGFTLTGGATMETSYGGGVCCVSTNCLVTNCVIINNAADSRGGGAYQGTLVNCILTGNSTSPLSYGNGGGAYGSTLVNCVLTRNFAGYAGGGANNCTLYNCLLYGNSVATLNSGGGAGVSTLINCTVVSNSAYYGGGTFGGTLLNCIVYNNQEQNPTLGFSNYFGGNFTNCCTYPLPSGANNFTTPPMFANLAAGDYRLNAASPCINNGNNAFITNATDLDGNPRIIGGIVDLGAYEFQSPIRYVNVSNAAPVSPFTSWATAATNIQDAVDASTNGDLILVTNGVYTTGGRTVNGYSLTNRVVIDKAVTVQSVNGPVTTVIQGYQVPGTINGSNAVRCVWITNNATLNGFTLQGGATQTVTPHPNQTMDGGGVLGFSTNATVSDCIIVTNFASYVGGGAFSVTLNHCTLMDNHGYGSGTAGAGIAGAGSGGGAANCVLKNCLVISNFADEWNGGGAQNCNAVDCVFSENLASVYGGGAYQGTLVNCTVADNTSGVYGAGYGGAVAYATLMNCIVYGNIYAGSLGFGTPSNYFSCTFSYSDTDPLPSGTGNMDDAPQFLAAGDFHLHSNSPCINSGNNAYVTSTTDLDGNPRIVGGTVDIGAYEYQAPTSVISYAWLQQYGLPTDGSVDYANLDGTSFNVYQDWIAGLNPTNALSVLAMLPPVPTNNPTGLFVSWESVSNRTYFLQSSTNLGAQPAFSTIQNNIAGQIGTTSYTDTSATNGGPYFYRVGVQQ